MFGIPCPYMKLSGCELINYSHPLRFNYFSFLKFFSISASRNKEIYNRGNYHFIMKFEELLLMMLSIVCIF